MNKKHTLEVWGELACFTRPEMKVERFSYPVITPSAARGIFDAIYWEGVYDKKKHTMQPYFHWQIERIEIFSLPRYIALRRNEVKDTAPPAGTIKSWMKGNTLPQPIRADGGREELGTDTKGRTQRQTMALKNVRYRLTARIVPKPRFADGARINKFNTIFKRRARQGKCFQQPYFGCREFPAFFEYVEPEAENKPPLPFDQHIGWMLYDVFDLGRETTNMKKAEPFISLFDARVVGGVMEVPPFDSDAVRKPRQGGA